MARRIHQVHEWETKAQIRKSSILPLDPRKSRYQDTISWTLRFSLDNAIHIAFKRMT